MARLIELIYSALPDSPSVSRQKSVAILAFATYFRINCRESEESVVENGKQAGN
jgi:hypothetical protein